MAPKYCDEHCAEIGPVCDFCQHYDFNGDDSGVYTGNGWCNKHNEPRDPVDGCEDYVCMNAKEE